MNKLITAANITNNPSPNPQKVIKIDSQACRPASFTKITQVVPARPALGSNPVVPKTTNIVYFDKTNNRFLPINSNNSPPVISDLGQKVITSVNPSLASNLNIKIQRSVVTINPKYLPPNQPQPPPVVQFHPIMMTNTTPVYNFNTPIPEIDFNKFLGEQDEEVIVEEEEELGHAETYANYMPSKCMNSNFI